MLIAEHNDRRRRDGKQEKKSPACPKSRKKYGAQHQQKQREKKRGERKEMKKAAKKLLTFVMAIAMLIGSVPMSAFAADTNSKTEISIKDGMYSVELSEVPSSKSSTSVSYNNFNVAPRAFLNVSGGKYTLVMRVYGYNYWNVVKVLSQEGWKNIETLKPGTDWKDYSGNEMSGYETLAAKSGDEATNKYWKTVEKGEIDKDKNMGLVSISLDNLNDAFAIGGYAVTTYNNKELPVYFKE